MKKLNEYLIYGLIFFLPTQLGKHFFFDFSYISGVRVDYLAPTLHLTDLIVIALLLLNIKAVVMLLRKKLLYITLILLAINIINALSPIVAVYKAVKIFELLALYIVIRKHTLNPKYILKLFLFGALLQLILTLLQFVNKASIQGIFYWLGERSLNLSTPDIAKASLNGVEILRPYGTFSHPNSLGGFYVLLYFFIVSFKPMEKYSLPRHILVMICTLLIFFSFSKVAIITFIVVNIIYLYNRRELANCLLCTIARLIVLGVLAWLFMSAQGDPLSLLKRVELIDDALAIFSKHPLLGVGMGNYLIAQSKFPILYSYHFLQPVHNIVLLLLAEGGLILTAFASFLGWRWLRKNWRNQTYLYVVLAILLTGLFDHYWLTLQQNMLLMPVVFSLISDRPSK